MSWFIGALKKYATFSGRARRQEYWMFVLFYVLFAIVASLLDMVLGTVTIITLVYSLAMIVPMLAVLVRRLHDQDKSGAWFFITFVPIVGSIWLLVLTCTEGTTGPNKYGEDPKAIS